MNVGDRVFQAFVNVNLFRAQADVRTLVVERVMSDGTAVARDAVRADACMIEPGDIGEVYCATEAEAWRACEAGLRRVAKECNAAATRAAYKAQEVANVVA